MEQPARHEKIFHICDTISLWGIFFLFFVIPFEREVRALYYTAQIVPITAWFAKILFQSTRRQWRRTIVQYLGTLAIAAVVVVLPGKQFGEMFRIFFRELGILYFCVLFIVNRPYPFRPSVSRWRLKKAFDFALGCYAFAALLSSFLSQFPQESFPQLRKGIVAYLLIYLLISNSIRSFENFKKTVVALYLAVLFISGIVLFQGIAYPLGNYTVKNWLVRKEAVRLFAPGTLNPLFHVQFPFNHFQKAGLFLSMGLMVVMVEYFITVKRVSRRWIALSGLIPFGALLCTLSQWALLSTIIAFFVLIILTKRKYFITMMVILLLLAVLMPGVMRDHYLEVFNPESYTDPSSRLAFRLERWALVCELILKYPVLGTGYGWKQFEDVYRIIRPGTRLESSPHPYSWYLQITGESGLVGLFTFLLFSAFLLALLFHRWRQQPPASYYGGINAALIALFIVPYIFGAINFIYRGGIGLLVWIGYGLCVAYLKLTVKPAEIDVLPKKPECPKESAT